MKALGTILAITVMALFASAAAVGAEAEPPSSCCGTLFESKAEAVEHMVEHHGKEGCAACGTLFETKQEKVKHAIEHHGKKGCVECGVLFENDEQAAEHARSHAGAH